MTFKEQIELGIPDELPLKRAYDISINHAPIVFVQCTRCMQDQSLTTQVGVSRLNLLC